jgi:hypothetical protein
MAKDSWIGRNVESQIGDFLLIIKMDLPKQGLYQRDVRQDIITDYEMLEEQLAETPEMIVFYDMLLAEQKVKAAVLDRRIEYLRGDIVNRINQDAKDHNYKVRREDITDIVESDEELNRTHLQRILETLKEDKLRAVVWALRAKNDNLRSLAGFKREERRNP